MDSHAKMTFHIGELYSAWAEQVCLYFSAPFNADGPLAEQPTAEKKAELERDAEAHKRLAEFDAAMVASAGPDAELTHVP